MSDDASTAARERDVVRYAQGERTPAREPVADEVPVAFAYNGIAHAVMLASPADLEDFAVGFSLSEGIVDAANAIRDIEVGTCGDGITVDVTIGSGAFARLKERRRTLAGRTGCGLCGRESLEQALPPVPRVASTFAIDTDTLHLLARALAASQPLHSRTGATHAAGWGHADGTLALVREDVGRHNALDKLIGALARRRIATSEGVALLTSRASSEMVHKCAQAGIPMLAAVSAPTGLAIRIADEAGVTLAAWLRTDRFSVYTHDERLRATVLENT
ncbi:MAG: formate dehydrogenase accessory sulfurtransferase FdhD [Burkholderiales bacterium]|nr:formate dehydrogenase accessory sulfurtransferase FdhD [Burkholderiales bacterium]